MTSRFVSNLIVLLVGAFLAASRFAFGGATVRWLALGAGCCVVVVVATAFLIRGRGSVQRWLDVITVATAAWTIVSSVTLTTGTVGWLAVGEGGAVAALAVAGLIAHELVMERGVVARDEDVDRVIGRAGRDGNHDHEGEAEHEGDGTDESAFSRTVAMPVSSWPT